MEDFMLVMLALFVAFVVLSSWILPWINRNQIIELRNEIERLKNSAPRATIIEKPPVTAPPVIPATIAKAASKPAYIAPAPKPKIKKPAKQFSFEQVFGARLPVWIGGVALILAGFFMVKYSIETGLITERLRIISGIIFGAALIYGGQWIRERKNIANGQKISQALTGAGIADLYICIYAATNLYHIFPQTLGFIAMAAVTAGAVILSLRHGAPIALLGLVGGFLTPAIIHSSEPDAPLLFIYLYFVLTGLLLVIRKQNWWFMAIPALFGAFGWVGIWLTDYWSEGDTMCLGLFTLAISATMVLIANKETDEKISDRALSFKSALNYLSLGGSVILMGVIGAKGDFGITEWGFFGILSLGGIALAYFNNKLYGFLPLTLVAVNIVMLYNWETTDQHLFALVLVGFALLYSASGYFLMWKTNKPLPWAILSGVSSLVYYLLGYYWVQYDLFPSIHMFWAYAGLALCGIATTTVYEVQSSTQLDDKLKQKLMAIFAICASAFLSLALMMVLKHEYLSVAVAAEVLVIALINTRVDIKALRYVAAALVGAFALLLIPQVLLLVQLTAYSVLEEELHLQNGIPIVDWPLFQLGLPALMFAGASKLFRAEKDDIFVKTLEVAAIALIGVMGYYLTRHAFHVSADVLFVKAGFIERGVITNILFLFGLGCMFFGRYFKREAVLTSGLVLCGISIFRIVYFDLIAYNPLWAHQYIGRSPLFNGLMLAYALPMVWTYFANAELVQSGRKNLAKYASVIMLGLLFVFVSFSVRQVFHGGYLDDHTTGNAETYAYSIAWLFLGLGLLFTGTLKKDPMIRVASLLVMILTVGKVFLYDASELVGLYRVFSFFGLGLSLLGLSWFYTRFVFGTKSVASKDEI